MPLDDGGERVLRLVADQLIDRLAAHLHQRIARPGGQQPRLAQLIDVPLCDQLGGADGVPLRAYVLGFNDAGTLYSMAIGSATTTSVGLTCTGNTLWRSA